MAQVQHWVVLQPLHKRGGRKTVIKRSPFGSTGPIAQTNEELWCQTGKHMGAQGMQHSPGMPCLQIPLRTACTWTEFSLTSLLPSLRRRQVSGSEGKSLTCIRTHFQLSGKKLCAASFDCTHQSHNYFLSFRSFWGSVICVSLRELPTYWEILIRFPRADISLILL